MAKKKIQKIVVIGSNSFSAGSLIDLLINKNMKVYGFSRSNLNTKNFLRFKSESSNFKFLKFNLNSDQNKMINFIKSVIYCICIFSF